MRSLGKLMPFDQALETALAATEQVGAIEEIPLAEALGRVAAEDLVSPIDIPGAPRAAMDGYAVRSAATIGATPDAPREFSVAGFVAAGDARTAALAPGAVFAIATGGCVPPSCDAVVEFEKTRREGEFVSLFEPVAPGTNVIPAGSDVARQGTVLTRGVVLHPARLGAAAAAGRVRIRVFARPTAAILTTGDEVRPPGGPLAPYQVYDANQALLTGLLAQNGCRLQRTLHVADDARAIGAAVAALLAGASAPAPGFILFTGGTSVGDRDFTRDVAGERGKILFHGIDVKPGRPTLLAAAENPAHTLLVGMPGYPASCLLVGHALVGPLLRKAARFPERASLARATLARPLTSKKGRTDFCPVRLSEGQAVPTFKGSHAVSSVAPADGYVVIGPDREGFKAGQDVDVVLF